VGEAALQAALHRLLGDRCLTAPEARQRYERDWTGSWTGRAGAVALPASTGEVAAVLQLAHEHRVAVVPQGGNTGLVGGAVPVDGAIVLSTSRMHDVQVDRERCQVVAGAGATLEAVQQAAAAHGLLLPIDLGSRSQATVGGVVATDAGGLLAHRHGSAGRWVRGAVAVTAGGSVLDRLDPPRKESAGFDLVPLLAGSEGTLAVLTALRLQLVPRPSRRVALLMSADDLGNLTSRVVELERALGPADAVEGWFAQGLLACRQRGLSRYPVDPSHDCHVLAQWSGDDELADRLMEDVAAAAEHQDSRAVAVAVDEPDLRVLWAARELHPLLVTGRSTGVVKVDTAVQTADRVPALRAAVQAAVLAVDAAAELFLFGHVMEGSLHVNVATERPGAVLAAVCGTTLALGGTVSAEHGIGRLKLPWMPQLRSAADLALMRSVKHALDPMGLLNPGVLLQAEAQERSVLLV
jgi:FAD/FMN-containing dehydrogenase